MSRPDWLTDDLLAAALELEADLGRRAGRPLLARQFNLGSHRAQTLVDELRKHPEPEKGAPPPEPRHELRAEFTQDSGTVSGVVAAESQVQTLEQLLERAQVDLETWYVERWVANRWETAAKVDDTMQVTPLWQVKAWLKRLQPTVAELGLRRVLDRIGEHAPRYRRASRPGRVKDPHLLEFGLHDHHFGKLAWHGETDQDYDLHTAENLYRDAVDDILRKVNGYPIERILFPVGSDFFNYADARETTVSGTPQDNDSRPAKVYDAGFMAAVYAIERAAEIAPTEVLWVPGNHDGFMSYTLVHGLAQFFRNHPAVEVSIDARARKYVHYGRCLIGLTHGDMSKEGLKALPTIMAQEQPELWAATRWREWHIGHYHTRREIRTLPLDTHNGVAVRVLPSLCGVDAWHYEQGFVGNLRASDAFLWSKDRGFSGHFVAYANDTG